MEREQSPLHNLLSSASGHQLDSDNERPLDTSMINWSSIKKGLGNRLATPKKLKSKSNEETIAYGSSVSKYISFTPNQQNELENTKKEVKGKEEGYRCETSIGFLEMRWGDLESKETQRRKALSPIFHQKKNQDKENILVQAHQNTEIFPKPKGFFNERLPMLEIPQKYPVQVPYNGNSEKYRQDPMLLSFSFSQQEKILKEWEEAEKQKEEIGSFIQRQMSSVKTKKKKNPFRCRALQKFKEDNEESYQPFERNKPECHKFPIDHHRQSLHGSFTATSKQEFKRPEVHSGIPESSEPKNFNSGSEFSYLFLENSKLDFFELEKLPQIQGFFSPSIQGNNEILINHSLAAIKQIEVLLKRQERKIETKNPGETSDNRYVCKFCLRSFPAGCSLGNDPPNQFSNRGTFHSG